jgi:nucleoside-diphosphate-sugar epimerase
MRVLITGGAGFVGSNTAEAIGLTGAIDLMGREVGSPVPLDRRPAQPGDVFLTGGTGFVVSHLVGDVTAQAGTRGGERVQTTSIARRPLLSGVMPQRSKPLSAALAGGAQHLRSSLPGPN